jgi:hypothetical protein
MPDASAATVRAVTPWLWSRKLRDHWPGERGALLTMLLLATYMGGEKGSSNFGLCWPTIDTLAENSSLNERTVRRHIKSALELGWLSSWTRHVKRGQGWKQTVYQAHVPMSIELTDEEEKLANTVVSSDRNGLTGIEPTKEQPFPRARKAADNGLPLLNPRSAEAPSKGGKVRTLGPQR